MKKVAFVSLGCPKNLVDTEYMLGALSSEGYEFTEDESLADIIIVNTCCFINDAKQESIDTIIDVGQWKESGNCKRLIVTGCLAQRYKDEIIKELPEVDAVVGIGDVDGVLSAVKSDDIIVDCNKSYCIENNYSRIISTPPYVAYLKVADGCDNHCTYCVIPSIRGKLQSKSIDVCVKEARELVDKGVFELVLLAQDLTNYGKDLYGMPKLVELLKELGKIDGLKWIRLLYCYPESITDDLIDEIANNDKVCKYIDIPIQHCNDEILKKMGRRGNKETIISVVNKLRNKIPDITIRTTLITGFPGETDEQYLEMENFIHEMKFDRLGVFAYSQEENTPAANMPDQIDEEVKQRRQEMLMLAQSDVVEEKSMEKVGSVVEVLVEGYDAVTKQHFGRSQADTMDIDAKIFFESKKKLPEGTFANVRIEGFFDYDLIGILEE